MAALPQTLDVLIRDETAGTDLVLRSGPGGGVDAGYYLSASTTRWQRSIVLDREVTIPSAGDRTWAAYVKLGEAGPNILIRDAVLTADGLY
jgi:hypothetical protein